LLVTPYEGEAPEAWQALSGMAFQTQVGVVYAPGAGGRTEGPDLDGLGQELNGLETLGLAAPSSISSPERQTYLGDLRAHGVTSVVVGPSDSQAQEVQFFTELLGVPGSRTGGVVVWVDVSP